MTIRLLPLVLLLACRGALGAPGPFPWGVSGHPHVQEGYRDVPVTTQLDLVAELGMGWYRCDWPQSLLEQRPEALDELVSEAARRGLHILPVMFPTTSCRADAPPEEVRAAAFAFARALAQRYRGRLTHYELDNELDVFAMVRKGETTPGGTLWEWGDPDGDSRDHYEETRYQRVRAELTGLHEGIRAGDPEALTIVNSAGWLHTGFFVRLVREDRVPCDLLGWHWYSEMGDMRRVRGELDLIERLNGFGKPLWITEINRRGGSMGGAEAQQAAYLAGLAQAVRTYSGVEACFAYELLDEPYFGPDNPESHYGLVELLRGPEGRWTTGRKKPAFGALRAAIR